MRIIIIGSGPAAVEAALSIRKLDSNAIITIFASEDILPYRRPLLPQMLNGNFTFERLLIHEQVFYERHRIEIRLNSPVVSIDWPENRVILSDQTCEYYDKLLLANGAKAAKLPTAILPDNVPVHQLHNVSDAVNLRKQLDDSSHVLIIGGGVLGLEIAVQCLQRQLPVTLVERQKSIMYGVLDESCSNFLQQKMLESYPDFQICTNCRVQKVSLSKQSRIICIVDHGSSERSFECDCAVQAVGFAPAATPWQPAVKTDRIEVDDFMQVKGFNNIFAAGDCVCFPGIRSGSYSTARKMGEIAGMNLAGKKIKFKLPLSEIRSSAGKFKLYSAGVTSGNNLETCETIHGNSLQKLYYRRGKLIGCTLLGDIAAAGELAAQLS